MMTIHKIQEEFPFLALLKYNGEEYIGIISNYDEKTITFYNYNTLTTVDEKQEFINNGNTWWWESNRRLPINIFLQGRMQKFNHTIVTFNTKHTTIVFGYAVSLTDLLRKNGKKKTIQLIRKY